MVDRQDIDALLIGALYGELTPADEARLTAHLESHPADRSALTALTETRATFRASGFATVQLDPPQAISAMLLQEAARRAPKAVRVSPDGAEAGWFTRFVRSFASHPAWAAATMLVLVAGIGGLVYSRQGKNQFAEQTIVSPPTMSAAAGMAGSGSAALAAPTTPDVKQQKLDENQEAVRVDLADADGVTDMPKTEGVKATATDGKDKGVAVRDKSEERERNAPKSGEFRSNLDNGNANGAPAGIIVNRKAPTMPKDLEDDAKKPGDLAADPSARDGYKNTVSITGNAGAGSGVASGPPAQQAPRVAPDTKPVAPPPAPQPQKTTTPSSLLAWAKDQHQRAVSFVNDNNCRDAAAIAAEIAAKANDYYNQYVANDRALKPCVQYINDAREKDAEKSNKARAQKRVDLNEPSPAPTNMR